MPSPGEGPQDSALCGHPECFRACFKIHRSKTPLAAQTKKSVFREARDDKIMEISYF